MKGFLESVSKYRSLELKRTAADVAVRFTEDLPGGLNITPNSAWMSNGGASRSHPSRSLPFSTECSLDDLGGQPSRIELIGVFARFADLKVEPAGSIGGSVQIGDGHEIVFRLDLIQGRHYEAAENLTPVQRINGDGTSLQSVGQATIEGIDYRVDRLTIDLPEIAEARTFIFRDLGTPASFTLLGAFVEFAEASGCPFHSKSGLIPLREVAAIVRVGDRRRFTKTLEQLEAGILAADDLDEARGQALTFLAVVTAGMLESGGARSLHRVQLEAARTLEKLSSKEEIAKEIIDRCESIASPLFESANSPSGQLVDRALAIVDRNFAKDLSDTLVAQQLGLSTSHFRFLFKQATGSPFHKYLIAVRLEKARLMLIEQGLPVSQVASAVGFTGLSHFSRAFAQRFSASPTSLRRQSV